MTLKFENYPRKNLIIAAVGDQSLHKYWIPKKRSSYDLFLINYGSKSFKTDAKYYIEQKGSKFNLINEAIENYSEILDYNFIQQYSTIKDNVLTFQTQWPAKLDGKITVESKSGATDPTKGSFSFKLSFK